MKHLALALLFTACGTSAGEPLPDAAIAARTYYNWPAGYRNCSPECADATKVGTHATPMGYCFLPGILECHTDERVGVNDEGCCRKDMPGPGITDVTYIRCNQ